MNAADKALLDATRAVLNANDSTRVILQILSSSQDLLKAEAASLFLLNRKKRCLNMAAATNLPPRTWPSISVPVGVGVSGWVAQEGVTALVDDVSRDNRFFQGVDQQTGFKTRGYLSVPLSVNGTILGTLQVLNQTQGGRFTREDAELLEGFAVVAALAINKSRMHEAALEKERMEAELGVAEAFQRRLLPTDFGAPPDIHIHGYHQAARSMGGDLYDGFPTANGFTFLVGDVSGKGPGAAIWMSGFSSALRLKAREGHDLIDNLPALDRHMHHLLPAESFITMFMGTVEVDSLRYVSAGHNSMLLLSPDGSHRWLESTGLPIGMMPDFPRETATVPFPKGSTLVLYTDGVSEAENPVGEMYGEKRLLKVVQRHNGAAPEELVKRIVRSVRAFARGAEQSDDITLMTVAKH